MNLRWTGIVFKLLFGNCQRILWWCSWPRWVRHWWGCSQDIIRSWVLSVNEMYLACEIKTNMIVEWKRGWDGSFAIPRDFQNGQLPARTNRDRTTNSRPKKTEATDCSCFESPVHVTQPQRINDPPKVQSWTVDSSQYLCDKDSNASLQNHWPGSHPQTDSPLWCSQDQILANSRWSKVSQFNTNATRLAPTHNASPELTAFLSIVFPCSLHSCM